MTDPVETELKLEYAAADRDRLIASPLLGPDSGTTARLVASYFDTPRRDLHKAGYTLRIRKEGRRHIQTVKAAGGKNAGLFVRGEWERPVRGDKPVLDARAGPLAQLFGVDLADRVAPIFTTDVTRLARQLDRGADRIECAIDQGEARVGAHHLPVNEIELELKSGSPQSLFDLARMLDQQVPLRLGVQTKSERGHALVEGRSATAAKADPIPLARDATAADAFATIAQACIRQYRLNEDLLIATGGVEQLHQARVAIRRLRSAFSLFKPLLLDDDRAAMIAAELRWLAGELGAIRDIDVLLPKLEPAPRIAVAAIRESGFAHLRTILESGRVRLLPLELIEWLILGQWRCAPADPSLLDRNILLFAGDRLDRMRREIKRHGHKLADSDDAHRHEVRKAAKKLRYAAEFFVALYPGRKPRRRLGRFLDRLEALQDKLGELNDIASAPALFERLAIAATPPSLGKKERRKLLDDAEDCFDALIDTKRFWRV